MSPDACPCTFAPLRPHRRGACLLAIAATVLAVAIVALGAPAAAAGVALPLPAAPDAGNLGTNLGGVNYYDGVVPFADLTDQAGDWVPQREGEPWGWGDPLTLRRDGWPAALAPGQFATAVLADVRYPSGTYEVTWSGRGTFDVNGTVFGAATGDGAATGGRGTVALDGTSIALLNIRATDPSDPVRDIDVRAPGEAPGATFRAAYLRQLAPYRVLRFMDWQRTNSTLADAPRTFTCGNRTLPGSQSQGTTAGASVERMVELANVMHADPWFTIPHEADPGWIACHARIVAASLAPGLTPRYEFANETWNPVFRAFHDLTAEAVSAHLGGGDDYLGLQLRVGERHAAAMAVVGSEFASAGRGFVRVLAGQAANAWVLEQRLAAEGALAATDEIAIAPYLGIPGVSPFDPEAARIIARWSEAELFAALARAQSQEVDGWIAAHVALAAAKGRRLVSYEGGQHLAGDSGNDALTALFTAANRASAMGVAYATYLDRWRDATGNSLFMHFTDVGPASRWGSWGALEFPEQGTSPKYDALKAFAGTDDIGVQPPDPGGSEYVAIEPARVVDTRASAGGDGPVRGGAGGVRTMSLAIGPDGSPGGVPEGATAVVYNVTVPTPGAGGHLRIGPGGAPVPPTSVLNFRPGESIANCLTSKIGAARTISVYASAEVDVIIDVLGYYLPAAQRSPPAEAGRDPAASTRRFTATAPRRAYDAALAADGLLPPGADRLVSVTAGLDGSTPLVPAGAGAVAYNLTVVRPGGVGHLRTMPGDVTDSPSSAINWTAPDEVIANALVTRLDGQGRLKVSNRSGSAVRFLVDVVGYYSDHGGLFHPMAPTRAIDTREASAQRAGPLLPGGRLSVDSRLTAAPPGAMAIAYNLAAVRTATAGHLRTLPAGAELPDASALNWPGPGYTRANGLQTAISPTGALEVHNGSAAPVDVIVDVAGYFG